MEIGPRRQLKPTPNATVTMRRINGKRILFFRHETDTEVIYHVSCYSTLHWIRFPKENHGV